MERKLLEGEVVGRPDEQDDPTQELEQMVERVTRERDAARSQVVDLQHRLRKTTASAERLRQQLEPLYRALQGVFGELEEVVPDAQPAATSATPGSPAGQQPVTDKAATVWEAWKERFGGATARIIDGLRLHGEANTSQLAIIAHCAKPTVADSIVKLNKAGLINKNGGKFSLKQI